MKNTIIITDLRSPDAQCAREFLQEKGYRVACVPDTVCLWDEQALSQWACPHGDDLLAVIHPAPPAIRGGVLEVTEEDWCLARNEGPLAAWCVGKTVEEVCAMKTFDRGDGSHTMVPDEADLKTALENDVTQINVGSEKCYLSPILDMYNGEIISYAISDHSDLNMVMEMLNRAYTARKVKHGLILHSDQGRHYQHTIYQKSLRNHEIIQSMRRKGNCLDNAVMESFFGIMKSELLYSNTFNNMDHFKQELRKYIEYYNNDRIKLRLKGMSPVEYRTHNSILS